MSIIMRRMRIARLNSWSRAALSPVGGSRRMNATIVNGMR